MSTTQFKFIAKGSTYILKAVVIGLGILALALGVFLVYISLTSDDVGGYRPILLGMVLTLIPFYIGLYQSFRLLNYIERKLAFSTQSVKALKKIKWCALVISLFFALCMPYIYYVAEKDDAPGGILIGLILIVAPFVMAVFAAILQELLQNAIDIQSENELTI